ncbi:hypothetical protein FWG76_00735 [Candidatus Saccharibacteria bacterium]|nr:hypothetical protein [Candidatus Saccharibacteria bacterium]
MADNSLAVVNGALAGNYRFFGDSLAEIASIVSYNGAWNGASVHSTYSDLQWNPFGGDSTGPNNRAGVFSSGAERGGPRYAISHRTILLG